MELTIICHANESVYLLSEQLHVKQNALTLVQETHIVSFAALSSNFYKLSLGREKVVIRNHVLVVQIFSCVKADVL